MNDSAAPQTTVIVAGDVTIDWSLARAAGGAGGSAWKIEHTARLSAAPGGAALLTKLVAAVMARRNGAVTVRGPDLPPPIVPDAAGVHHSHALWSRYDKDKDVWRVKEFLGVERAKEPKAELHKVKHDERADLVVLDDAGLGFREHRKLWPRAIDGAERPRWILLKICRPVCDGDLWKHLLAKHAGRLVVVMAVDDLRRTSVKVSHRLSWEQTAQDIVWELLWNPAANALSRCAHVIVSLGTAGAVLLSRGSKAQLVFDPEAMEGEWEPAGSGGMIGNTSILTAAVAAELLTSRPALPRAIDAGVAGMRKLFTAGLGAALEFPVETLAAVLTSRAPKLSKHPIEDPERSEAGDGSTARYWTIMGDKPQEGLARSIALDGLKGSLSGVPVGRFGKLVTVDRREIEDLRSIRRLFGEYVSGNASKPISVVVFGPPGSGKSFAVKQLAEGVAPGATTPKTFNLSQFVKVDELYGAFHQVRDISLSGKLPVIFWDEFDTPFGGEPLGWLRYFIAPMQDGEFQEGQITHPIGRAIFVFAGGTEADWKKLGDGMTLKGRKAAKVPDFVSRLKGALNVLGPNQQKNDPFFVIRRAILLRSLLEERRSDLFEGERLRIDDGVLHAFLQTKSYHHGARSLEALLAMSTLTGKTLFDRSSLPAETQMNLHVDSGDFMARVEQPLLDPVAAGVHAAFCEIKFRQGWKQGPAKDANARTHPYLVDYDQLPEDIKEANRISVRAIPRKLAAIGYAMMSADGGRKSVPWTKEESEKLARMEHEIWMNGRLEAGLTEKDNENLVPWERVPEELRDVDRHLVRSIPKILAKAGFTVVKVER